MARIFSWEEIPDRVPKLESFKLIGKILNERLFNDPAIIGAIIYGSLPHGTVKLTSNVDVLVLYESQNEHGQPWILSALRKQAARLFVPIDFRAVDIESARLGTHRVDLSLKPHLYYSSTAGWAIKCDPIQYFRFFMGTESTEFFHYLRRKIQYFEDQLPHSREGHYDLNFLQAVIETPVHVVRKMLPVKGFNLFKDAKENVVTKFQGVSIDTEYTLFKQCLQVEEHYLIELRHQLEKPDQKSYTAALELIRKTAPTALTFLKLIAANMLASGFEENKGD